MIAAILAQARLQERVAPLVHLRRRGDQWWGCCPFHEEKTPSFKIEAVNGCELFRCWGCGARGNVIHWTMLTEKINKGEAVRKLADELGIEQPPPPKPKPVDEATDATALRYKFRDETIRLRTCMAEIARLERGQTNVLREELSERQSEYEELTISLRELFGELYPAEDHRIPKMWNGLSVDSVAATHGRKYLASRGITIDLPADIRFAETWNVETKSHLLTMICAVRDHTGAIAGVHRTYLSPDGAGKAKLEKDKMMLGKCSGGAVRLANPEQVRHWSGIGMQTLAVTEGIETGLSVQQKTGLPTWAALSTSGVAGLIVPPPPIGMDIVIYADNDQSGIISANKLKQRMESEGRRVRVELPPSGLDFNDLLMRGEWI